MKRQGASWLAWVAGMLLVVIACGDTPTPAAGGAPASITSGAPVNCDQLADLFLSINQQFLDDLGNLPAEDFQALMQPLFEEQETLPPPVAKLKASSDALRVRLDELGCTDEELQRLAFSRADRLEARGSAGELWISILLEENDRAEDDLPQGSG
jgi:hypothetical protein